MPSHSPRRCRRCVRRALSEVRRRGPARLRRALPARLSPAADFSLRDRSTSPTEAPLPSAPGARGGRRVSVSSAACRSRSPRPSCPSSPGPPRSCPRAPAGSTSPSGTASARSRSSTAPTSTCSRAAASRCGATSPSSSSPTAATCSTARSSCSTSKGGRTSTRSASASTPPSRGSGCSPSRRRRASSPSTCWPLDDESLLELPQAERRDRLEGVVDAPVDLTPATEDPDGAQPWLQGAEGVIAKRQDAPYRPGERVGMAKIKRIRTIDAVVMGWRPGKEENTVGSLILGLYDDDGPPAHGRAHLRPEREAQARAGRRARSPTRPASAGTATRAAGRASATSSGSSCGRSW